MTRTNCRLPAVLFLLCSSYSSGSFASDDQRFIGIECRPTEAMLRVSYHRDHLHPLFREGYLVDTFNLKKNDPSGEFVHSIRTVTQQCRIGTVTYRISVYAVPGAERLNAACGGETFGGVKVMRNGRPVLEKQFEQCSGDTVTIAITFGDGANVAPEVVSVPKADFR